MDKLETGDFPTKGHVSVTTEISTVPKRFKAEDIVIDLHDDGRYFLRVYTRTKAEAQAALELLRNL